MFPIDALLGIGGKLIDRLFPDENQANEAKLKLLEMQQNGELAQINADISEQHELTERLEADMSSDSWLSKNIRPLSLIAIFLAYFLFTMMSTFGYNANESYVQLLGSWGQLIFGFYFGSRCLEKITEMRTKPKEK
jgi:hypothetical protein